MDKLSAEQRHKNMAAIHGKDTKPEWIVRRGLWSSTGGIAQEGRFFLCSNNVLPKNNEPWLKRKRVNQLIIL